MQNRYLLIAFTALLLAFSVLLMVAWIAPPDIGQFLKDFQVSITSIIVGAVGFGGLIYTARAVHKFNIERDDRLREIESRVLAAEITEHLPVWDVLRDDAPAHPVPYSINCTIYEASADKIGILGPEPAAMVVMTYARE